MLDLLSMYKYIEVNKFVVFTLRARMVCFL